jgi:putative membrane protein
MPESSQDSQELAEERTDWAEDRTILANERTFSSWMGTGLGSLGLAVGMQAVFGAMEPTWIAKSAATVFVIVSLYLFQTALINSRRTKQSLDSHTAEPVSNRNLAVIAHLLSIGAVCAAIVLWLI